MSSPPPVAEIDHGHALEEARARGEHRVEPVRFRFIEALARRAAGHHGLARRLLDERVGELLAAYRADARRVRPPSAPPPDPSASRGPLGELVDGLADHAAPPGTWTELKTLRDFRSTWSRLHADQRLTQSRAQVPDQAGPLNSQHLVHRTLSLMRELSPGYLDRFMAYCDALAWLEQLQGPAPELAQPRQDRSASGTKKRGKAGARRPA